MNTRGEFYFVSITLSAVRLFWHPSLLCIKSVCWLVNRNPLLLSLPASELCLQDLGRSCKFVRSIITRSNFHQCQYLPIGPGEGLTANFLTPFFIRVTIYPAPHPTMYPARFIALFWLALRPLFTLDFLVLSLKSQNIREHLWKIFTIIQFKAINFWTSLSQFDPW
jgi:hypothetical protein